MKFPGQPTVWDQIQKTGRLGGPQHDSNRTSRYDQLMGEQEAETSPAPNYRDAENEPGSCQDCANAQAAPMGMDEGAEQQPMKCGKYGFNAKPWMVCDDYAPPEGGGQPAPEDELFV